MLVPLALVSAGAWHYHRLGDKALLGGAKCLHGGGPRLAPTEHQLVLGVLLGTWNVFNSKQVLDIGAFGEESCRVSPGLLELPVKDFLWDFV